MRLALFPVFPPLPIFAPCCSQSFDSKEGRERGCVDGGLHPRARVPASGCPFDAALFSGAKVFQDASGPALVL